MIQLRSILVPADNTGARKLQVIGFKHGSKRHLALLGEAVKCIIMEADPRGIVKDDEKVDALIVRTKKETRRLDGSYIRFDDNAVVLIDKEGNPRGTRIFGPVAREIKEKGFSRIASQAQELV